MHSLVVDVNDPWQLRGCHHKISDNDSMWTTKHSALYLTQKGQSTSSPARSCRKPSSGRRSKTPALR